MDENQIEKTETMADCIVTKFPIRNFGKDNEKIRSLYPDTKLLVFCVEPWKILGTHVNIL